MGAKDSAQPSSTKSLLASMLFVGVFVFVVKLIQGENLLNAAGVLVIHCALSLLIWTLYCSLKK
jgi:uncharacterized membrane protein YiaA